MNCTIKRIYFTEARAVSEKYRLKDIFQKDYYVYKCVNCTWWHLSTRRDGETPRYKNVTGSGVGQTPLRRPYR